MTTNNQLLLIFAILCRKSVNEYSRVWGKKKHLGISSSSDLPFLNMRGSLYFNLLVFHHSLIACETSSLTSTPPLEMIREVRDTRFTLRSYESLSSKLILHDILSTAVLVRHARYHNLVRKIPTTASPDVSDEYFRNIGSSNIVLEC